MVWFVGESQSFCKKANETGSEKMASNERKDRVFLSYASEDLVKVRQVYESLIKRGLDVWFDKEHLRPGKWKPQITRAITKSRYFVICISNAAIRKTGDEPGFQDEELNEAYEIAKSQSVTEFAILPVRLEDCHRGDHRLTLYQQYDIFENPEKVLDKLAVHMGGISLSDSTTKDERTDTKKFIDTLYDKAVAESHAGRFKESIALLDAILALSTDEARVFYSKGIALSELKKHEESLETFEKSLKIDPTHATTWIGKGIVLQILDRNDEALEAFKKALQIDSKCSFSWSSKGFALQFLGRNDEALEAFKKALEIDPNSYDSWLGKGYNLGKLGRNDEALEAIDKALQFNPNFSLPWQCKGSILHTLGRLEEAVEVFDKALQIDPNTVQVWIEKGFALSKLGKDEESGEAFDKVAELIASSDLP
jgi:tetratricopeptide (TPR) repeat protein